MSRELSKLAPDVYAPLDYAAITRILPHRHPFLLVDRIVEFESGRRIVGVKNVSSGEPCIVQCDDELVLPPAILMEAMARSRDSRARETEHRDRLIYFSGHCALPASRPGGNVVVMEARVDRIRGMMGRSKGERV